MEREISVSTKADLSGVQAVRKEMEAIRDLAREIAKNGVPFTRGPGGGPSAQQVALGQRVQQVVDARGQMLASSPGGRGIARLWARSHAQRTQAAQQVGFTAASAAQFGQSMIQQEGILAPYLEQFTQNMTPTQAAQTAASARTHVRHARFAGSAAQNASPQSSGASPYYVRRAFANLGSASSQASLNPFQQQEYAAAYQSWLAGDASAPQAFFAEHGAASNVLQSAMGNAPSPAARSRMFAARGGSQFASAASSLASGGLAEGVAGAVGGLVSTLTTAAVPLLAAGAALDLAVSSFNAWQQQGLALSNISKQSLSAGDSLGKFMNQVDSAGAALGYLPTQVAQIANILSPALGNIGTQGLVSSTQQTWSFARAYGLDATSVAQAIATAAQMGLLQKGLGGTSQQGLNAMFGAMTYQGGMQGRTGQVMAALLQTMQTIQSRSVIPSGMGNVASQLTALSATGVRGLQGASGAALLSQVASGMASPGLGPAGQALQYQALGLGNPFLTMFAEQMGPGYVLPSGLHKGQTAMQAILSQLQGVYGRAKIGSAASGFVGLNQQSLMEESVLGGLWNVSMPQAGALLSVFGAGQTSPVMGAFNSLLKASGGNLSKMPSENVQLLAQLTSIHNMSQLKAVEKAFTAHGGHLNMVNGHLPYAEWLAPGQKYTPPTFAQQKRILTQDLGSQRLRSLTSAEQYQVLKANIQNAQISVGHAEGKGGLGLGKVFQDFEHWWHQNVQVPVGGQTDAYHVASGSAYSLASYNTSPGSDFAQWMFQGGSGGSITPQNQLASWDVPAGGGGKRVGTVWNPARNIAAGTKDLNSYLRQYGNLTDALAAYNEGPGNLAKYGIHGSVRTYVSNILALMRSGKFSSNVTRWSPQIRSALGGLSGASPLMSQALIEALMAEESGGSPTALSPAGAMGLMQLMPATAQGYGLTTGPVSATITSQSAAQLGQAVAKALEPQFQALARAIKGVGANTRQSTSV